MTAAHLLSAYIDINAVLIIVAIVWFAAKHLMMMSPLRTAYQTQLNVLYGLVAMVVLSPFVGLGIETIQRAGILPPRTGLSFTDFLVSQYLHGNIAMTPSKFEHLLMMRTELTHNIVSLKGWFGTVLLGALFLGFIAIVLRNARDTLRLIGIISRSYVLRRVGRIDILFTHETAVPFSTRGLLRHYIVLPTSLLAQNNDVRIAVSHEIQHVRQRDLTWEIMLELLRPFFFWNPAFTYCKRDVERFRELACDQQVLQRSTHPVRDYCECLLRVCKTSLSGDRTNQIITPSVPFAQIDLRANASHSESFLKRRILSLLESPSSSSNRFVGTLVMLCLISIVFGATIALRPVNDWTHDRLMLSTIVNLERLNTRAVTP